MKSHLKCAIFFDGVLPFVNNPFTPDCLSFNPGRIDPTNAVWDASRKPLVAHWETPSGDDFFTINLHLVSKDDGSSTQGNARPPVNLPVDVRTGQVTVVAVNPYPCGFSHSLTLTRLHRHSSSPCSR